MPESALAQTLREFGQELTTATDDTPFYVFLCGPNLTGTEPAANLRRQIRERLEREKFLVVLGEDEGLEDARLRIGLNAQDNELEFISRHCHAVIVIASSPGSFCELGLFSWHFTHKDGKLNNEKRTDFILLVDCTYQGHRSYLNEGPARVVDSFGVLRFVDFSSYDAADILQRLKTRRSIHTVDNKIGRPHRETT